MGIVPHPVWRPMNRYIVSILLSLGALSIASVGEGASLQRPSVRCSGYFAVRAPVSATWSDVATDRSEAERERVATEGLSPDQRAVRVVPRFAALMPMIREILDAVPRSAYALPYAILDANGESTAPAVSNIGQAIGELRAQAHERERTGAITQSWFPEFALEALAIEEIASRNWAEAVPPRVEPPHAHVRRLMSEIRQREGDAKAGERYENVFSRVIASKREFQRWLRTGLLAWPSPIPWEVRDFRGWHLGTRVLAIAQDRVVFYDGLRRGRFFFYVHDILGHPLPEEFLPFRERFTDLEQRVHGAFDARESDEAILLRLIWFGVTHETPALYRAYAEQAHAHIDFGPGLVSRLAMHLAQAVDGVPGGEVEFFVGTLMHPHQHQSDLSPSLRALSRAELTVAARKAIEEFHSILRDEAEHHRAWLGRSASH